MARHESLATTGIRPRNPALFRGESRTQSQATATVTASDIYPVNFTASTGKQDRWTTELNLDILYPDRSSEDGKLLVYTGAPLATDVEISGSPVVVLEVASTATDGAFFAYLEDVAPDGHVTYLDEGELRAINRKQMDMHERPYNSPGSSLRQFPP